MLHDLQERLALRICSMEQVFTHKINKVFDDIESHKQSFAALAPWQSGLQAVFEAQFGEVTHSLGALKLTAKELTHDVRQLERDTSEVNPKLEVLGEGLLAIKRQMGEDLGRMDKKMQERGSESAMFKDMRDRQATIEARLLDVDNMYVQASKDFEKRTREHLQQAVEDILKELRKRDESCNKDISELAERVYKQLHEFEMERHDDLEAQQKANSQIQKKMVDFVNELNGAVQSTNMRITALEMEENSERLRSQAETAAMLDSMKRDVQAAQMKAEQVTASCTQLIKNQRMTHELPADFSQFRAQLHEISESSQKQGEKMEDIEAHMLQEREVRKKLEAQVFGRHSGSIAEREAPPPQRRSSTTSPRLAARDAPGGTDKTATPRSLQQQSSQEILNKLRQQLQESGSPDASKSCHPERGLLGSSSAGSLSPGQSAGTRSWDSLKKTLGVRREPPRIDVHTVRQPPALQDAEPPAVDLSKSAGAGPLLPPCHMLEVATETTQT